MQSQNIMNDPIPSESIEVTHSEANPAPTPVEPEATPSAETPEPEAAPVAETPEVTPETPETPAEADLYELPDGRKVDGQTLAKEWKENFLPDYTRKSQELAAKDPGQLPTETPEPSPFADPDYVPSSYEEIIQVAEARALATIEGRQKASAEAQTAAENAVIEQLDAVKKIDPAIDENKLFQHANKYGFRDLSTAHQNMLDMGQITKTVQKQTAENIAKRKDPVSVAPGGHVGNAPDPSHFSSAVDYMRSLGQ